MGKGQQKQVNTEGTNLLNSETANAGAAQSQALSGFQSLYNNPGYTPGQQSSITNATLGGIGAAEGTAGQKAANNVARTRNSAGLTAQDDVLSRQAMQTGAAAGASNQAQFADAARADKLRALGGFQSLYGTGLGGANSTLGTLSGNAKTPGFWQTFGQSAAGALGGGLGLSGSAGGFGFGV